MSTESPFAPFTPPSQLPPMFEAPTAAPEPVKRKRGRPAKAKVTKASKMPAEKVGTAKRRKPRSDKQAPVASRHSAATKRAPKFDLQTILRVAATLKEADQRMFERLLGELSAMPKASRARILAALHGVFG